MLDCTGLEEPRSTPLHSRSVFGVKTLVVLQRPFLATLALSRISFAGLPVCLDLTYRI